MIWIDPRAGSGELAQYFRVADIPVTTETMLDSADFMFVGNGPGKDVLVGIERKTLPDLLQCMNDERFVGQQLRDLTTTYEYPFLFVEGVWRATAMGTVERLHEVNGRPQMGAWYPLTRGPSPVRYSELTNYLNTLRMKTRLIVVETADKLSTASHVINLYNWFNKKWEEHRSHLGQYDPAAVLQGKSTFERRVAMQLDGIGYERSAAIANAFSSVKEMAEADEKTWMEIEGIGKTGAKKIVKQFRGNK